MLPCCASFALLRSLAQKKTSSKGARAKPAASSSKVVDPMEISDESSLSEVDDDAFTAPVRPPPDSFAREGLILARS